MTEAEMVAGRHRGRAHSGVALWFDPAAAARKQALSAPVNAQDAPGSRGEVLALPESQRGSLEVLEVERGPLKAA